MGTSDPSDLEPHVARGYRIRVWKGLTTDCTIGHTGHRSRSLGGTEEETVTERKEMSVHRKRTE